MARQYPAARQRYSAPAKGHRGPPTRSLLQSWLDSEGLGWLHHANYVVEAQLLTKGRGGTAPMITNLRKHVTELA